MPHTLTRSTSCDGTLRPTGRLCWSSESHCRRSGSFTLASCRLSQHDRVPKCPVGGDASARESENSGWARLSRRLKVAFLRSSLVTSEHPAGACLSELTTREHALLRDELFSLGQWSANKYTRTLLLDGGSFNVMLLCWAPGCASPVHGHSCAETMIPSNCESRPLNMPAPPTLVIALPGACCVLTTPLPGAAQASLWCWRVRSSRPSILM